MEQHEVKQSHRHEWINSTEWSIQTDKQVLSGGDIVNFNKTGVCVTLPGNLPILKGEAFTFILNHDGENLLEVNGKVHWIRHSTITNNLYIGLRFDQPLDDFEKRWTELQLQGLVKKVA